MEVYFLIFRKARPFFFMVCLRLKHTLKKKGRAFRNIGKYTSLTVKSALLFFLDYFLILGSEGFFRRAILITKRKAGINKNLHFSRHLRSLVITALHLTYLGLTTASNPW